MTTLMLNPAPAAPTAPVAAPVAPRQTIYGTLGMDVSKLTDVDAILAAGGAEFVAYTAPGTVACLDGVTRPNGTISVIRDDTNEVLGTHKPGYHVIQYKTVVETAMEAVSLAGVGAAIDTIGVMKDGAQFYAAIDLGSLTLDPNGVADVIKRFLLVFASHNGTFPVMFMPRAHRLACMNELPMIRQERKGGFGFAAKHTKNMLDKLATARSALGIADAAAEAFEKQANAMLAKPATKVTVERVVNQMWPLKAGASDKAKTQHDNRMARVLGLYDGQTNAGGYGHNAWAAYNAITEYLDHGRGTTVEKRAIASMTPGSHVENAKVKALTILSN